MIGSSNPFRDTASGTVRRGRGGILWLVALALVAQGALSAAAMVEAAKARPSIPPGTFAPQPASITRVAGTAKTCSSVSTCSTGAVSTNLESTLVVMIAAKVAASTVPTTIVYNHGTALTCPGDAYSATTWLDVCYASNIGVTTANVYVNWSAPEYYVILVEDYKGTTTSSYESDNGYTGQISGTEATEPMTVASVGDVAIQGVVVSSGQTCSSGQTYEAIAQQADIAGEITGCMGAISMTSTTEQDGITWGSSGDYVTIGEQIAHASTPSAPTGLSASSITTSGFIVSWTLAPGPTDQIQYVNFSAKSGGVCGALSGAFTVPETVPASATSYAFVGGAGGGTWCAAVTDGNSTGYGTQSSPLTVYEAQVPNEPTAVSLAGAPNSTTALEFTWTNDPIGTTSNITVYGGTQLNSWTLKVNTGSTTETNYEWTGLTSGSRYCMGVSDWNATGQSTQSVLCSNPYELPAQTTGLAVTGENATNVSLVWTNPTFAQNNSLANDTLFWGTANVIAHMNQTSVGAAAEYTLLGLSSNTKYHFYVAAWDQAGEQWITTNATVAASTLSAPPNTPYSLQVTGKTSSTVSLSWDSPGSANGNLVNYTAYFGASGSDYVPGSPPDCKVAESPSPVGTYNVKDSYGAGGSQTLGVLDRWTAGGLSANTAYCLEISAWTVGGQGPLSLNVTFTTTYAIPSGAPAVVFVASSTNNVTWSWTIPANQGTEVNATVYLYAGGACAGTATLSSAGPSLSESIGGLGVGTTYSITVTWWNNGGPSPHSPCTVGATRGATPPAPFGLQLVMAGPTWLIVAWTNPAGYELLNDTLFYHAASCGGPSTAASTGGVVAFFNLTGLSAGTTYCIEVEADDNNSAPSSPLNTATTPGPSSGTTQGAPFLGISTTGSSALGFPVAGWILLAAVGMLILFAVAGRRRRRRRGSQG